MTPSGIPIGKGKKVLGKFFGGNCFPVPDSEGYVYMEGPGYGTAPVTRTSGIRRPGRTSATPACPPAKGCGNTRSTHPTTTCISLETTKSKWSPTPIP